MISFFQMIDPDGIANWSVTHVDWSEGKWHPKLYNARDITPYLIRKIKVPLVLLFLNAQLDFSFLRSYFVVLI